MFVIKVDYFIYDKTKENGIGRLPMYLGVEPETRAFVFGENLCSETKYFDDKEYAEMYLNHHFGGKSLSFDNARVVKVEIKEI